MLVWLKHGRRYEGLEGEPATDAVYVRHTRSEKGSMTNDSWLSATLMILRCRFVVKVVKEGLVQSTHFTPKILGRWVIVERWSRQP